MDGAAGFPSLAKELRRVIDRNVSNPADRPHGASLDWPANSECHLREKKPGAISFFIYRVQLDKFDGLNDAQWMLGRYRIIKEVLDEAGNGLVSSWVAKELSSSDRAIIDVRFNQIEINETRNPKWLDHYVSLKMSEIRVKAGGKAIRFLCIEEGTDVVLVVGCVKKGQIKPADERRAVARRDAFRKGELRVRNYPLPQRPPDDLEEPGR